jgi:putative oxygen-independent coproporphyrinogen III oxidase
MTTLDLLRRLGQQPSHRRLTAHSAQGRRVEWREEPGFGVYVHIPFCRHRCHYCDFNTYEGQDELHESYVAALIADILRTSHTDRPATSVFFGGGTPTLLPPEALVRILRAIEERIGLAPEAEVTTEANPETVDARYFERLLDGGFNRFSLGMQSMAPNVLEGLGRTHSGERALGALTDARRAGASDVNLDLIYGSVWERPGDWERTLHGVIAAGPDHVSAYALTIEEGTPLGTLVATGRVPDVDPDVQAERYEVAHSILAAAGYEHYEISNWARPGRTCDHNLLYWSEGDYLGFGAGAHGHLSGRRYWTVRLPRDFIGAVAAGATTEAGAETLERDERAGEALMLGIRVLGGVDRAAFERRFPGALAARAGAIERLTSAGLLEDDPARLRLTTRGLFLANEAGAGLL